MTNTNGAVELTASELGKFTGRKININDVTIRSKYDANYGTYYNVAGYYATQKDTYQVSFLITEDTLTCVLTRKSDEATLHIEDADINAVLSKVETSANKKRVGLSAL